MDETLKRATDHLRRADPVLADIIRRVGPCRLVPERKTPVFAALAESIIYQQITGKAAATIHGRLLALAKTRRLHPDAVMALSDSALRGVGLSRQKTAYLRDLAQKTKAGMPRVSHLPDDRVVEVLTEVKGIGRWTAHMFLIFRLGRPDVLPVDDYGIQKAMRRAYKLRSLPNPKKMARLSEGWRPYRSIACWYLWRSIDGAME